jgi:hypothetical protein
MSLFVATMLAGLMALLAMGGDYTSFISIL